MTTRRSFFAGALATGLCARPGWAEVGSPVYLAAARIAEGRHALFGLDAEGAEVFRLPLPGRGHAAAAHPVRPEAVAFARRPGTFALVVDCRTGAVAARLEAPEGRHFYGHGAFSADGGVLYTTENDYARARGVIGLWDATRGYRRVGEADSHGVGPHEILRIPGTDTLVVANGGIETHPDSGRAKLNIPQMRPNIAYLSPEGGLLDLIEPPAELRRNSIRHLAARPDGLVALAMQWQGESAAQPPLLGLHRPGGAPEFISAPGSDHRAMNGYAGSVAFSGDGRTVAISSPRGGLVQVFDCASGRCVGAFDSSDVCGLAADARKSGYFVTSGAGDVLALDQGRLHTRRSHPVNWDNHVVPVGV